MTEGSAPSKSAPAKRQEDHDRDILRTRAEALARPPAAQIDRSNDTEFASFSVDGDRYAVETSFVREVLPLPEITPLPGRARVLVGVTSLRGEIVPVAALGRLFGGAGSPLPAASYLVVLGQARAEVGVLATEIGEAYMLDPSELSSARRERALTRGVTRDGLVVLEGVALLSDPRLSVEDDDAQEHPAG
jgi:purine-binding chemotaxis protein CheW